MPHYRLPPLIALLWLGAMTPGSATATPDDDTAAAARPSAEQGSAQPGGYADPADQWLEEVRAQRRAREERRRAAKEAISARRRLTDPWGAAHQEAHEKEIQRRHDAMMEQIERDREAFREQGPWRDSDPIDPGPPPPPVAPPVSSGTQPEAGGSQGPAGVPTYPPSGWNNRWYYRGY